MEKEVDYLNSEMEKAIDEHIHNERNRHILKLRFIDGWHFEELAGEFHLSVSQVKNIVGRSKITLFKHIHLSDASR